MSKISALNSHIKQRVNNNKLIERERVAFANGGNVDQKHDRLWLECGYPTEITAEMFRFAYERYSPAKAGIDRIVDKCWQTIPTILEADADDKASTPWELSVNDLLKKSAPFIMEADKHNAINRYAGLIIQLKDGRQFSDSVNKTKTKRTKERAILRLIPAWEEQLKVCEWDNDENSDNYGQPTMYEFQESEIGNRSNDGKPSRSIRIHPDRIIILSEGSFDGSMYSGVPMLRAGFNDLIDMAKVSGSSAEGFLKNASRQLAVNYTGDNVTAQGLAQQMGVKVDDLLDVMNDDISRLNEAIDAAMITMGADVKVLAVAPADPKPTWEVSANQYASSLKLPFTIIFGQQTGRLASDEDKTDYAMTIKFRCENWLDWLITHFVERMIRFGVVDAAPAKGFYIKWPDLLAPSELDKAELLVKLGQANTSFFNSGQVALLTVDEARNLVGMEPIEGVELTEDDSDSEDKKDSDKAS